MICMYRILKGSNDDVVHDDKIDNNEVKKKKIW